MRLSHTQKVKQNCIPESREKYIKIFDGLVLTMQNQFDPVGWRSVARGCADNRAASPERSAPLWYKCYRWSWKPHSPAAAPGSRVLGTWNYIFHLNFLSLVPRQKLSTNYIRKGAFQATNAITLASARNLLAASLSFSILTATFCVPLRMPSITSPNSPLPIFSRISKSRSAITQPEKKNN